MEQKSIDRILSLSQKEILEFVKQPIIGGITKEGFLTFTDDEKWDFVKSRELSKIKEHGAEVKSIVDENRAIKEKLSEIYNALKSFDFEDDLE